MRRLVVGFVLIMLFAGTAICQVRGAEFSDAAALYSVRIPDNWVFQAKESGPSLNVFYGIDEHDLLYFEVLDNIFDQSAEDFGQRALELYSKPGGLDGFKLRQSLSPVDVGGVEGVKCSYTYRNGTGVVLWEERIFLILPAQRAFSIALGGIAPLQEDSELLDDIIRGWRWSFED